MAPSVAASTMVLEVIIYPSESVVEETFIMLTGFSRFIKPDPFRDPFTKEKISKRAIDCGNVTVEATISTVQGGGCYGVPVAFINVGEEWNFAQSDDISIGYCQPYQLKKMIYAVAGAIYEVRNGMEC